MNTTTPIIDVTTVSEDAEQLVRDGGVLNRPDKPWAEAVSVPFAAELIGPCPGCESMWGVHTEPTEAKLDHGVPAGTVTVVDAHHADDCRDDGEMGYDETVYCHPDAKPDMWHWTVKPTE